MKLMPGAYRNVPIHSAQPTADNPESNAGGDPDRPAVRIGEPATPDAREIADLIEATRRGVEALLRGIPGGIA